MPISGASPRRWIITEVENSLRRLGTDWIDVYQIHRPDPATDIDETLGVLSDLVHQGKVRYSGHSTFPASEIVEAQWTAERHGRERFRTEQPLYSILARAIEHDVLPTCQRYGMGVMTYSPLAMGWLSGHYRKDREIAGPGSPARRQRFPERYDLSLPVNQRKLDAADALGVLADKAECRSCRWRSHLRPASRGDCGDYRAAHHGAPRVPARRRRRHAER